MPNPFLNLMLPSEAATGALARRLAPRLRAGDVVGLRGELGVGKTTFARALIRRLVGAEVEVPSPTFNLVLTYELDGVTLWHFDLYRLEQPEEAFELGIEEAFADGISLIEWPERLDRLLPEDGLTVALASGDGKNARRIAFGGGGDWPARLRGLAGDD